LLLVLVYHHNDAKSFEWFARRLSHARFDVEDASLANEGALFHVDKLQASLGGNLNATRHHTGDMHVPEGLGQIGHA
jgi:hypothetical protein